MSRIKCVWVGLVLLIACAAGGVAYTSAQAPRTDSVPAPSGWRALPLLDGRVGAAQVRSPSAAALALLQRDSNIPYGYYDAWQSGAQLGVVLRGSDLQYPLTVRSIEAFITRFPGAHSSARLRAHVYGMSAGLPDDSPLASSVPITVDLTSTQQAWVRMDLTQPWQSETPRSFLVVVEYLAGTGLQTPSVVLDVSTHILRNLCYYRVSADAWSEHYDMWSEPAQVGYPMIRAWAETSGGPAATTMTDLLADAILTQGQPDYVQGIQTYLMVGEYDPGWDNMRTLLRFPLPEAPMAGATPVAATVRLYQFQEMDATVPLSVTAHRVVSDWNELNATWFTYSNAYAEAYGTAEIPARAVGRDRFLQVDVSALMSQWLQGIYPDYGIMLLGGEDVEKSARWFYSRHTSEQAEMRPKLIVQWALPAATPTWTPTASPTGAPTETRTPTVTPTPTANPELTPSATATASWTETPTSTLTLSATPPAPPTATSTPALAWRLILPLIRRDPL